MPPKRVHDQRAEAELESEAFQATLKDNERKQQEEAAASHFTQSFHMVFAKAKEADALKPDEEDSLENALYTRPVEIESRDIAGREIVTRGRLYGEYDGEDTTEPIRYGIQLRSSAEGINLTAWDTIAILNPSEKKLAIPSDDESEETVVTYSSETGTENEDYDVIAKVIDQIINPQ